MALPENFMTPADYLKFERASDTKHEYFGGEVFAMSGASLNHNRIVLRLSGLLDTHLRQGPCEALPSDMRIRTRSGLYTYPDISAVCGELQLEDGVFDTLVNPTLIIEVLSPSTEGYDHGKKFQHYRTIESLREYVLIAQDSVRIERYVRQPSNDWVLSEITDMSATLELTSIQCQLAVAAIYERVTFEDQAT